MQKNSTPFSDIKNLLGKMPAADVGAGEQAKQRQKILTKPQGSLGKLEQISCWLSQWGISKQIENISVAVFAGNHGIAAKGVSAYPQEVTKQMVANFTNGGAAINQICKAYGLNLKVFELSLDIPTKDISQTAAMEEKECAATIAYGMEAIVQPCELLCIGEMGIGNTTIASAIYCALFGGDVKEWVGPGTGHDEKGMQLKVELIEKAIRVHENSLQQPLEVLRCLGGREIAAMCGAILAARLQRIPVIIDGFVATSAAAILYSLDESSLEHCMFAHLSSEPAHKKALAFMKKEPLLNLEMRLGEATGAALAAGVVRAASMCHFGMATFEEAAVSGKGG